MGLTKIRLSEKPWLRGSQLKEFNRESIRLRFSHNLEIDALPDDMCVGVVKAYHHFSTDGLRNVRLVLMVPRLVPPNWEDRMVEVGASLIPLTLDVTNDAWVQIQTLREGK